jgi:amidohydrolase
MTTTTIEHARAPHSQRDIWERWWSGVTGAPGEIVWNAAQSDLAADLEVFGDSFDRGLPVIDLGCGDGRQTRFLARHFQTVIGVDISPSAIQRASAADKPANVSFRVLNVCAAQEADQLHEEVGDANVYVRGVLQALPPAVRSQAVGSIAVLLGDGGTLFAKELPPRVSDYFADLVQRHGLWPGLERVMQLIPPGQITEQQLVRLFSPERFEVIRTGQGVIDTLNRLPDGEPIRVPAVHALIRPRRAGAGVRERHVASESSVGTELLEAHDDLGRDRAALEPELIQTRRTLHRTPELAFAEHRTAKLVADRLRAIGYEPRVGVGGTGIVADLEGGRPGPTLLIRADMDALPLDELPRRSYGSQVTGRMRACGHDAHTSALLGLAALLTPRREQLAGRVRLLFQPAEETGQGAQAVIHDGALEGVDEALMAHVFSPLPFGTVALRQGVTLMGTDMFELTVDGGGGHAGLAHETRDAVLAGAQLITALQTITARETSPLDHVGLTIASLTGGTAANVVANKVTLRGTLRWLDTALRERALARISQIADGICSALRVSHQLEVTATVPALRCAAEPSTRLAAAAASAHVTAIDPGILPVSDDFAHIAAGVPAALIAIGAGGQGCGVHHAPDFDIDERAIGLTTEILTRAALSR